MSDSPDTLTPRRNPYKTIAIVASCLGLTTACGIGPAPKPPPPPPLSPLQLSVQQLDFAPIPVGDDASQSVTVTNPTAMPVAIGNIRFEATGNYFLLPGFVRTTNCTGVLAPQAGFTIKVFFNPQHEGPSKVFLVIDFDKYLFLPQRLAVSGVALPKP